MSAYVYANDQERLDYALGMLQASDKTAEMWRQEASDYIRRWRTLEDEVVRLRADLSWAMEYVVEPEWFPNEGDRQYWHGQFSRLADPEAQDGEGRDGRV